MKRLLPIVLAIMTLQPARATEEENRLFAPRFFMQTIAETRRNFSPGGGVFGSDFGANSFNFNNDADFGNDPTAMTLVESRIRTYLGFNPHQRVNATFALELNPVFGREQGFADYRINNQSSGTGELRIKNFYVDIGLLTSQDNGAPLYLRIGRQGFDTVGSLIVGDPDAEGFTLYGFLPPSMGRLTMQAAILDTYNKREIEDWYLHLRYDFPQILGTLSGVLYGSALVVRDDSGGSFNQAPAICGGGGNGLAEFLLGPSDQSSASGSDAQLGWVGLNLNGSAGDFFFSGDLIFNFGPLESALMLGQTEIDTGEVSGESIMPPFRPVSSYKKVRGWLARLLATWDIGVNALGVGGAFVTGDDGDRYGSDTFTGFLDVNADFNFTRFFFDGSPTRQAPIFGSPIVQGSGLMAARVTETWRIRYDLSLNLLAAGLWSHKSRPQLKDSGVEYTTRAAGSGRYYGTEIDAWFEYTGIDWTTFFLEYDTIIPGSYFEGEAATGYLSKLDPAYQGLLGVIVDIQ